jgi:putative transposase
VTSTATFAFHSNRYRVAAYLCNQKVELRYDPFDLTRIEVWFQNTFLQLAEPERVVTTTHPDVELDPLPTPAPDTGLDYLALLRTERERLLQQQLQGIRFSQLQENAHDDQPQ